MTKAFPSAPRVFLLLAAAGALFCAACTLQSPTQFVQKRVEIVPGDYDASVPAAAFDRAKAREIAAGYARDGHGTMEITVTYDPHSRANTARAANDTAARVSALLKEFGVADFRAGILPVNASAESLVLLRYPTLTARAPEGCIDAFRIDDINAEAYRNYAMGCTTETYISKQVAKPSDLLGRDGTAPSSGRRQNNIIERYQSGTPNPEMQGIHSTSSGG
jgi:type IV pilus biogenesis protein CpaD/CtpE